MTVQQFVLHDVTDKKALAAVATDGKEVRVFFDDNFAATHSQREFIMTSMQRSFERKLGMKKPEDVINRLQMNLTYHFTDVVEYETFDQAQAAAQEALHAGD